MNFQRLRSVLFAATIAASLWGPVQAQTMSVNGANCPGATVTLGAGTIAINTSNCIASTPVAPTITSGAPPTTGNVGAAYSHTFTANGSTPISWSVTSGALPTGLTLSSGGVVSGPPTAAGMFTFQVTASNGTAPAAVSPSYTVTIANLPVITSTAAPNGTPNIAYTHQFTANQAVTAWSTSPEPPAAWLLLNATGFLSGNPMPANAGPVNFTVSATTANGTATQVVAFNVIAPAVPAFTSGAPTSPGTVGSPYSFSFAASGSPAPAFALVTANSQPTGLSLSSAGVLSGTPGAAGTYMFAVQASNSAGSVVSPAMGIHSVVINPQVAQTGAVLVDIAGNVIPRPISRRAKEVIPQHIGLNGGGSIQGQEFRGWAPDPSRCTGTPAISRYWYHNIDMQEYGAQNALDYLDFPPNEAVTYGFVPAAPPPGQNQVGRILVLFGPSNTPAGTFLSISTSPCDFDGTKLIAGNTCYVMGSNENGMLFQIVNTNPANSLCKLTPGTQYYLNLRFQDPRPAPTVPPNTDACATQLQSRPGYSNCGALLQVFTYAPQ